MSEKLRVREVVLVEGRYDAAAVANIVDGLVLPVDGFSIFTDDEMQALIKKLGRKRGLLILTDSDAAGFRIRRYIEQIAGRCEIRHAYIPAIQGKEGRKAAPSKEGTLGVEGMPPYLLRSALEQAGVAIVHEKLGRPITYTDLYKMGLSGQPESAARRRALLRRIGLPQRLSKRALVQVLSSLYSFDEFVALFQKKPMLFWDFHGTLTLPDVVWFDAAMEAAAQQVPERPLEREVLERQFSRTCLPWFTHPEGDTRALLQEDGWWAHCREEFTAMLQRCGFTRAQAARIAPVLQQKALQPHRYHLYPDALPTLRELQRRGYYSAVLSNNFPELRQVVSRLGLLPYLVGVITSGRVGFEKPRREIFDTARELAEEFADDMWMIGDSPKEDIEGGKAAGFVTVAAHTGKDCGADYHIDQLADILDLLE